MDSSLLFNWGLWITMYIFTSVYNLDVYNFLFVIISNFKIDALNFVMISWFIFLLNRVNLFISSSFESKIPYDKYISHCSNIYIKLNFNIVLYQREHAFHCRGFRIMAMTTNKYRHKVIVQYFCTIWSNAFIRSKKK